MDIMNIGVTDITGRFFSAVNIYLRCWEWEVLVVKE